jgi:hypothetical protein
MGTNAQLKIPGENVGCGSGPTNPKLMDSDGDTVVDGAECLLGTDPNDPNSRTPPTGLVDSDRDGLPDSVEALFGSDPHDSDTDGDGLVDGLEVRGWGTSPTAVNTDGDGCNDNVEIADINGDYKVSIGDLTAMTKRAAGIQDDDFGVDPPFNFSPDVDITKDGRVSVGDVTMVEKNMGQHCG